MGNPELYSSCYIGTKKLVEDFNEEVISQLDRLSSSVSNVEDLNSRIDFLKGIRQAHGTTALMLSGGGSLGLYHIGVLKCLFENNLLPKIISGSSSGSIVASILCTRLEEEFPFILDPKNMNLNFFGAPLPNESTFSILFKRLQNFLEKGVAFDTVHLRESMQQNLGDLTFLEAYNRTRRILNIAVSSKTMYEMPRLLNYLTAPNVVNLMS